MSVKRYDLTYGGIDEFDDGRFVNYTDYAALDAEAAGLRKDAERYRELIEAARSASATLGHIYHTTSLPPELEKHAHDDYQRLDAALKETGGLK